MNNEGNQPTVVVVGGSNPNGQSSPEQAPSSQAINQAEEFGALRAQYQTTQTELYEAKRQLEELRNSQEATRAELQAATSRVNELTAAIMAAAAEEEEAEATDEPVKIVPDQEPPKKEEPPAKPKSWGEKAFDWLNGG